MAIDQHYNVELERKFLLNSIPNIEFTKVHYITQSYLVRNEDQGEIRLRKVQNGGTTVYLQAFKSIGNNRRREVEFPIDESIYVSLLEASGAKSRTITKVRFVGLLSSVSKTFQWREIEIDEYLTGKHHGLLIGEVEFNSIEQMEAFDISRIDWIEEEVTGDPHYKNYNLAITNTDESKH